MRCVLALGPVALLAAGCGAEDPVAKTLAQSSEHVELSGIVTAGRKTQRFHASGDFRNHPDEGSLRLHVGSSTVHAVITESRVYLSSPSFRLPKGKQWLSVSAANAPAGTQTPARVLRAIGSGAHYRTTTANGLVRHIEISDPQVTMAIDFSRFGEPIRVHIPASAMTVRQGGSK
ncbi:MAG TPA: hypothetical protein VNC40_12585 [Gaiellaceae bacterium]|nr:hypothetical protein [Gaiellaceae bacterium]